MIVILQNEGHDLTRKITSLNDYYFRTSNRILRVSNNYKKAPNIRIGTPAQLYIIYTYILY